MVLHLSACVLIVFQGEMMHDCGLLASFIEAAGQAGVDTLQQPEVVQLVTTINICKLKRLYTAECRLVLLGVLPTKPNHLEGL